jgi:hypothetical protein
MLDVLSREDVFVGPELAALGKHFSREGQWLFLLEALQRLLGRWETLLDLAPSTANTVRKILLLLPSLILDEGVFKDPGLLRRVVRGSGLAHEAKARNVLTSPLGAQEIEELKNEDLKSLLLRLQKDLDRLSPISFPAEEGNTSPKNAVRMVLHRIEHLQLLTSSMIREDQTFYLPIPYRVPGEEGLLHLFVHRPRQGRKKRERSPGSVRVVVFLQMKRLGPIRVDAAVSKKSVGCTIEAEKALSARWIKRFLPELSRRLESLGWVVEGVSCRHAGKKAARWEEHVKNLRHEALSLVDLFA